MKIKVKVKKVFGAERIYPVCEKAELFRKISKSATLMPETLDIISELGFDVVIEE